MKRLVLMAVGAAAAGLVGQPLDFQGESEGLQRLLNSSEVTREWQFINVATNREWARTHTDVLVRWLREPSVAAAGERFAFREVPVVPRPSESLTDTEGKTLGYSTNGSSTHGIVTAFITSFYMFRLLYMTFFGDYRGAEVDEHGSLSHNAHGHGEPHESPMIMLVPLMILAVLSLVGGLVGIGNRFENFLAPVFGSAEVARA